jgi:uncharacterized membrane protein YfcA
MLLGFPMIAAADTPILVLAGAVAGLIGSAGGITSLVSYPALLAVGVPAVAANIANNVALVGCWPGSALGSRAELRDQGSWLWRWSGLVVAGAVAGSALLLSTPAPLFASIVPFLVAGGSLALLIEPRLSAWNTRSSRRGHGLMLGLGLLLLSLYNGYFGAGAGVMTLTLLLVLVDRRLPVANALKNMLLGACSAVSALLFTLTGTVHWSVTLPLAAGMVLGSRWGPVLARRLPAHVLRRAIFLLGMVLAVGLWLHR